MATCAVCQAELPDDARFCPACSAPVTTAPPSAAERKLATVLFADLVGSTALGGSQDPERTRAMLERFYEAMSEEVEHAGGTVEKFAGDSVLAAFGVPIAHEDDAERALHTALSMRRRLDELFGDGIALRVGVNTGEVVVGRPRAGSSFVTGDPVNVAARLEQAAEPGEILVGERTAAAVRGAFEFDEPSTVEARGKPEGVIARRLVRALSLMRPRGVSGLGISFVGRDRELELLCNAYRAAVNDQRPHLVTILGDPGVGKTRLVREFWDRLESETPEPLRRTGRCLSYGVGVGYWALGEVLKEHLGLLEDDPPDRVRDRLGEREILGLALGLELGHDLHPLAVRDRFQDAWSEFLSEAASKRPTVVLIEDAHWGEDQLLDVLEHVLTTAGGPLLLVVTARPELVERRPGWGARGAGRALELEPLTSEDSFRMLQELFAGGLPPALRELVVQHAEGNPFFVEELLGMLIDRGFLARSNGSWKLAELPGNFDVPDSVQAVLAARIDLLEPAEKAALQAAAVIGRIFWAGPVYELVEAGEPDLRILEERDLIRRRMGSTLAGDREYAIKHALTREVAYASLPKADRARLHAAFADWLDRTGEGRDEHAALLAHHYAEAARPEDADLAWPGRERELQRIRGKALFWLERAAELAMGRYEIEDALALLDRALALTPDQDAQARLWRAVGKANAFKFDGEAFWTAMESSLRVCTSKPECAETYSELAFQTAIRSGMWRKRPASTLVEGWIERALELSEPQSGSRAKALIARCFWGRAAKKQVAREASALAEQLGNVDLRSYAWGALSIVAFADGDFQDSLTWSQRRLDVVDEISDPDHVADIYEVAIPACCAVGRFREARRLAAAHDLVVESLSAHHRLHGIAVLLEVEELYGGWDRILALAESTEAIVEANLQTPCIRNARSLLVTALAAAQLGDLDAARRYEQRAEEVATEGYDFVLAAPRVRLALLKGDSADQLVEPIDLGRGQTWFTLPTVAARLDALAMLRDSARTEEEAAPLLGRRTYLEPFALRALGIARGDNSLVEGAIERFREMHLDWHAEETRRLVAQA